MTTAGLPIPGSDIAERTPLRVLHVGVANRGRWPLEHCKARGGFVPAALCDVSADGLAEARRITGLPESACYRDLESALAQAQVDCAILCVPTVLHVPLATKAIEAGLPVLIEKGMAPDWASARQLARTVAARGAKAAIAQNYRYNGMERTVWRAINDPTYPAYVGEVHLAVYTQNRVRPHPRTLNYPFASVWDMSCHHLDNLLMWFGAIEAMNAFSWGARWSAYEYDNNTAAHITVRGGTRVHYLHTHDAARNSLEIELHGQRGALYVQEGRITFNERPTEQLGSRPIVEVPPTEARGLDDLLADFHRYIVDGVEPGVSVRNNLETMAACEMMVRSITHGRAIGRDELD